MKPVAMALNAIAAIERETREAHTAAASAGRSETLLPRDLSQSSLASGNDRHGPDAPSAYRDATVPLIDHLEPTAREAACAWDGQIRIETQDRIVVTPARNITAIVTGALLSALALFIGWTGGLNSDLFTLKPASLPVKTVNSSAEDRPAAAKSERLASASTILTAPNSAHESKRGAQTADSLLTKQAASDETPLGGPSVMLVQDQPRC